MSGQPECAGDADVDGTTAGDRRSTVTYADNPGGVSIEQLVAEVPPEIAALGERATWHATGVAPTGATVWRLEQPDGTAIYLKVAPEPGGGAALLRAEAERLQWFAAQLSTDAPPFTVPTVLASVTDAASGEHYLAVTALAGVPARRFEAMADADVLLASLARALRTFHELPADACPFAVSLDDRLAQAEDRLRAGLVDRSAFEPINARHTPEALFEHLLALRPDGPDDLVVVHGDPTLDNTLVEGARVTGYVDLGRAGVSDRYLDLAIIARELAHWVSPHALGPFFSSYGLDAPDLRRIDFYLLLDEFF